MKLQSIKNAFRLFIPLVLAILLLSSQLSSVNAILTPDASSNINPAFEIAPARQYNDVLFGINGEIYTNYYTDYSGSFGLEKYSADGSTLLATTGILPTDFLAFAADQSNNIFMADWYGIYMFDENLNQLSYYDLSDNSITGNFRTLYTNGGYLYGLMYDGVGFFIGRWTIGATDLTDYELLMASNGSLFTNPANSPADLLVPGDGYMYVLNMSGTDEAIFKCNIYDCGNDNSRFGDGIEYGWRLEPDGNGNLVLLDLAYSSGPDFGIGTKIYDTDGNLLNTHFFAESNIGSIHYYNSRLYTFGWDLETGNMSAYHLNAYYPFEITPTPEPLCGLQSFCGGQVYTIDDGAGNYYESDDQDCSNSLYCDYTYSSEEYGELNYCNVDDGCDCWWPIPQCSADRGALPPITITPTPTPAPGCHRDGLTWCSNHGGIALTIDHDIDPGDWAACLSWCDENMVEGSSLCQFNNDGPRSCWVNYAPGGGIDSCDWQAGTPPFGAWMIIYESCTTPTPTDTPTPTPTDTPTPTPTDTPTPTPVFTPTPGPCDHCWARTSGGIGDDESRHLRIDAQGNIFSVGYFTGTNVEFNTTGAGASDLKSSNGEADIFLTKYNSDGTYSWTKTIGGIGIDNGYAVTTDANDNIYITGAFTSAVLNFNTTGVGPDDNKTNNGDRDIFITKFNSDGSYAWTRVMGGLYRDVGLALVSYENTIYLTGYFDDANVEFNTTGFGPSDIKTTNGYWDIFITKYGTDGSYGWTRTIGGAGADNGSAIDVDSSGNVYSAGDFSDYDVDFNTTGSGSADLKSGYNGSMDAYITKYASDGSYLWTKTFGGDESEYCYGLRLDAFGSFFLTGMSSSSSVDYNGSGTGSPDVHAGNGNFDGFLSKYTVDGDYLWAKTFGGVDKEVSSSLALDQTDGVYLAGYFESSGINFNNTGVGVTDIKNIVTGPGAFFLTKYDKDGSYIWTKSLDGTIFDPGFAVAVDQTGQIYASGHFGGSDVEFNLSGQGPSDLHSSNGGQDFFFTKISGGWDSGWCTPPTPTPTPIPTPSPTATVTPSATIVPTATQTPNPWSTNTVTVVPQGSPTVTPTLVSDELITDNAIITPRITTPVVSRLPETGNETEIEKETSQEVWQRMTEPVIEFANDPISKMLTVSIFGGVAITLLAAYPQSVSGIANIFAVLWFYKRDKKKRYGLVFDANTKEVIPFAVVSILNSTSGKLINSTVSDLQGRYHMVVNAGSYTLEASQSGYEKYFGTITISGTKADQIVENIALVKNSASKGNSFDFRGFWVRLSNILFFTGFILALLFTVFSFSVLNIIVLCLYILQAIIALSQKERRGWGILFDVATGEGVAGGFISVLDISEQRQIDVQISDKEGRYGFMLENKNYLVKITTPGYSIKSLNHELKRVALPDGEIVFEMNPQDLESLNIGLEQVSNLNGAGKAFY